MEVHMIHKPVHEANQSKSIDWFLHERELRHERVKLTFQSNYDFRRAPEGFHCVKSI